MIVWRVENNDGCGPYQSSNEDSPLWAMCEEHNCDQRNHPSVSRSYSQNYVCGFQTKNEALVWFDDWWDLLEQEGFDLVQYDCDPWFVEPQHPKQLMFDKRRAEKL